MPAKKNPEKGKHILIVDDEPALTAVFAAKLKRAGFTIDIANDGDEALKKIAEYNFDLIILDLMMPKKNGFDTMREIRSKGLDIPVIIASNLSQDEDIKKVMALGANDYFIKANTSLGDIVKKVSLQFTST